MLKANSKIIVILGPTSSGKSDLAIKIALRLNSGQARKYGYGGAEIISADSRQIYRGMNIGSGKVPRDNSKFKIQNSKLQLKNKNYFSSGIRHHMIDVVSPKTDFNVSKFKHKAEKVIKDILKRNKLPIICGGTGFWIKALVDNVNFPEVKPDFKLREKLGKLSAKNLFVMLKKLDPTRANNIDKNNKVRLIRAIEICRELGKVPPLGHCGTPAGGEAISRLPRRPEHSGLLATTANYRFLQIGINLPKEKLHQNIQKRLKARFKKGMIKEVENLHFQTGVSWKRLEIFGLEYRYISQFLQKKLSKKDMQAKLLQESKNYAKRQMTWFRKDPRILWLKDYSKINKTIKKFLH